jgi:hypothetical protein
MIKPFDERSISLGDGDLFGQTVEVEVQGTGLIRTPDFYLIHTFTFCHRPF